MSEQATSKLSFPEPDIALITLDDPHKGANILSQGVLAELEAHLDALDRRAGLAGLVLESAKPNMFVAGADIREFLKWIDASDDQIAETCRRGQKLFGRLAENPYVTVAVIDGVCVGGGAELAMWCDRRVMTTNPATMYGFPEVKLGLFPGWGGTARCSRMIGLANAIEMVTGGESVAAEEAYKLGLADDLVAASGEDVRGELQAAAIRMIRAEQKSGEFRTDRQRWSGPLPIDETELGFLGATASAVIQQQTKGHYPAPLAALEVMLGGAQGDLEAALQLEAAGFSELFGSDVNRALINVFFLQDHNKRDPGVADGVQPGKIRSASVIGGGTMGQGIAAANVKRGIPVKLMDASQEAVAKAVRGVLGEASYNKKLKGPDAGRALELSPLLNGTLSIAEVATSEIVVEAVFEQFDVKRELFAKLEPHLRDDAILASNTSTIPITKMAAGLAHPERFCGLHFFNPVRSMPLVEVIRGAQTSDQTIATAVAYARKLKKSPIVVGDGPGFLVNRLLFPYMNESLQLLIEGVPIKDVERAAKGFGMPMGPITLFDVVGLDVAIHAGQTMYDAFPDRTIPSELLTAIVKSGRLGQKNGRGFHLYQNKKGRGTPDPEVQAMIDERILPGDPPQKSELVDRMILPMVCEATRILAEGLVRDHRAVDLGLIYGIGFPPFQGGLLFWADRVGIPQIVEKLQAFAHLGARFEPTEMLLEMARDNRSFYGN